MAFAVVLSASWVCDDARDRLPNAEAFLWTGLVLLTGLFAAVTRRVSDAAFVLYALSLYGARTRGRSWWAVRNGRRSR
ncbi:hypothetical protein DWB78_05135 [Halopelagius longus]|uniref:Uncharacterized protein n=2 Tax=Halopelagius longus TaxID=1236180 RepID=A0A1H1D4E8_9EURY|nr:hypothetical protein DWB78_05135 [Halopelagius longus]SDQ71312.1 hypothetical protein SAMN05216278_2222 [Halopelagius longus]